MTAVVARIMIRYIAGALVARGLLDDGGILTADPDVARLVETGLGIATGAAVEAWYYAARRFGWSK